MQEEIGLETDINGFASVAAVDLDGDSDSSPTEAETASQRTEGKICHLGTILERRKEPAGETLQDGAMKLLMIYATRFGFTPEVKTLPEMPDAEPGAYENVLTGFIHVEPSDTEQEGKILTKLVKNLKWLAGKNATHHIVLHSFSHLAEEKADPAYAKQLLDRAQKRLETAGYQVHQTPFGYFLALDLQAPGTPLARVFKNF